VTSAIFPSSFFGMRFFSFVRVLVWDRERYWRGRALARSLVLGRCVGVDRFNSSEYKNYKKTRHQARIG
jgi:hypothetical protein